MRLLKPAPGEAVDRQTILELKMKHGGMEVPVDTADAFEPPKEIVRVKNEGGVATTLARQKFTSGKFNIQPFIDEHEMIQSYLEREWFPSLFHHVGADLEYDKLYDELAEVNAELWKLEDRAHAMLAAYKAMDKCNPTDKQASDCFYGIIDNNQKRMELVGQINRLFGLNVVEKIYP